VTAITTGLLFLASIGIAPLIGPIPNFATAPALILVGAMMVSTLASIEWNEPRIAIPSFLTIMSIPLTYSIATGLAFGIISFVTIEIGTGNARRQNWVLYLLAALFCLRFAYILHT
jgi:AGZA family xanthine/uracil permease-like MFS transporter